MAIVTANEPSTTNLALPSASGGSRSWMTRTNRPEIARRMKIWGWVSGHRPVTATVLPVARMKIQDTIRTTRS